MAEKGNKPKPTISSPGPKARRQTKHAVGYTGFKQTKSYLTLKPISA